MIVEKSRNNYLPKNFNHFGRTNSGFSYRSLQIQSYSSSRNSSNGNQYVILNLLNSSHNITDEDDLYTSDLLIKCRLRKDYLDKQLKMSEISKIMNNYFQVGELTEDRIKLLVGLFRLEGIGKMNGEFFNLESETNFILKSSRETVIIFEKEYINSKGLITNLLGNKER